MSPEIGFGPRGGAGGPTPPPGQDEALIRAAQARDPAAWAEIYERFSSQLLGFFTNQGHGAQAEDLTSETFIEALRAADRFTGTLSDLRAWLFRIARNNLIDDARRRRRQHLESLEVTQEADLARALPADDPGDVAVANAERSQVYAALRTLSPDQREVLVLRLAGGLTAPEIAAVVGKSTGAVKALQHRALQALARALGTAVSTSPPPTLP